MNYYPINPEILRDLAQLKTDAKAIISNEMGLQLSRDFFIYQSQHYPIKVKFKINDSDNLSIVMASFNPKSLGITVNYYYYKYLDSNLRLNLLRHELAHYLDFIQRGDHVQSHDSHYRKLCCSFGWNDDVYSATIDQNVVAKIKSLHKNQEKSQKLLALALNNPSWEEAQSALLKAKSLMQQNQLSCQEKYRENSYIAIELIHGQRFTQKYQTLSQLLEHFQCKCIVLTTPGHFTLEVITQMSNKDYIIELFQFFDHQIDLWFEESKINNKFLHRNSFYIGLQRGFEEKIKLDENFMLAHQRALILSNHKDLQHNFKMLYPRTSKSSGKSKHDHKSFNQGKMLGLRLELKNKLQQTLKFLT